MGGRKKQQAVSNMQSALQTYAEYEKKFSQEKLAEKSGFDVNYVGALERGELKK